MSDVAAGKQSVDKQAPQPLLERLFGLSASGSNVRTEFVAGLTTFLTMVYIVFVNPQILSRAGVAKTEEGCLSVPGIFDEVERAATVRVRARDRHGKLFEQDLEGALAVCLQHEMDHLDGKLFVDYLSDLKRERIRKKLEKERKEKAAGRRPAAARSARAL